MKNQLIIQGDWNLKFNYSDAEWNQRVIIKDSIDADGYYEYPGALESQSIDVHGNGLQPWHLRIEHNDGSGWSFNELNLLTPKKGGGRITYVIESRDTPGSNNPFNDLVLQANAQEIELISVPSRPFALRRDTLQMSPEGVFESLLGTCYMSTGIMNKWSQTLPGTSNISITSEKRQTLQKGGIAVIDNWAQEELELLEQKVTNNWVKLGSLEPGKMRTIYFKLDCKNAEPQKHTVEFELEQPFMPDITSFKFKAEQKIFASRSGYNSTTGEFYSECDCGKLILRLQKMVVEYSTLLDAIKCARAHRAKYGPSVQDQVRQILQDLLSGNRIDLCKLKRLLDIACEGDGDRWPCRDILIFPTEFEYRVEPKTAYAGKFGPLPYEDPFWKALLALIAWLLTIAAAASAIADLWFRTDRTVIGTLFDSKREKENDGYYLVDAALCELDGSRPLPSTMPPIQILDAQSDEDNLIPVEQLDGVINLKGDYLTNSEIIEYANAYKKEVTDLSSPRAAAAVENALAFKSGGKTGLTFGVIAYAFDRDPDGKLEIVYNKNGQPWKNLVKFKSIPDNAPLPPGLPDSVRGQTIRGEGDSGSLWIHWKTRKIIALHTMGNAEENSASASRIQDVMNKMGIRFIK